MSSMAAWSLSLVLLVSLSSLYQAEAENRPTTCSPNTCQNGGECKTSPYDGSHHCFCKEDYYGQFCEKESPCATGNPCVNGGTCQFAGYRAHGYWCNCPTGYYGQNCENISPCLTGQPCQNGGTCRSTRFGYSCSCASAYYGKNCEGTSPCLTQQPCKNGASCFGSSYYEGNYFCRCKPGYLGRDCEKKSKCLTDKPCLNGGTCHTAVYPDSRYYCICPKEFRGKQCQRRQCPKNMAQCFDQNQGFYGYQQGLAPAECLSKYRKIYQCFNKTVGEIVNLRDCDCELSDLAHSLNEEMDPDVWSVYSCYFGPGDLPTTGCSSRLLSCISTIQRAQYFFRPAPCNDQTKQVKQQVKKCLDDYQAGNLTTSGKCAPVQKVLTFVAPLVKLAEKIWCTNCNVLDFYEKCLFGNKEPRPGITLKYKTVCDMIGTPDLKNCLVAKVSAEPACETIKDEVVKTADFYLNQMKAVHQGYCQKVASFPKIRVNEWNCPATEE